MAAPQLAGFDLFWSRYPRRVAKGDARKAWAKLNPSPQLCAEILAALEWQREQDGWQKDDGQYIPYPASYLRGERWEDEPVQVRGLPGKTVTERNLRGLREDLAVLDDYERLSRTTSGADALGGRHEGTVAHSEGGPGRLLPHLPRRAG
jgi:uncharacterized protein YhdP